MSTTTSATAPLVPAQARTDPWNLAETGTETVADLSAARVEGSTVVYEDRELRERMRERTGLDQPWRQFFATELSFVPGLPAGARPFVGPAVSSAVRESFAADLRDRGLRGVTELGSERVRVDSGERADATTYRAAYEADGDRHDVGATVATWHDGTFLVAGGFYPLDPGYRGELLDLIRGVSCART